MLHCFTLRALRASFGAPGFAFLFTLRPRTKIELLDALGDAHGAATHYEKAALFHERALQQKHEAGFPPSEIVTSYSAVATDATNLFHFEEALSGMGFSA